MTKSILLIIGLLISTNLLAQEVDPQERQTNQLTYSDVDRVIDSTNLYRIHFVFRKLGYAGGGGEFLYTKYVDYYDKATHKLVSRLDIREILKRAGYKVIDGIDQTKSLATLYAASDTHFTFGTNDMGMVSVDIRTKAITYNHLGKDGKLTPFWGNNDFILALLYEDRNGTEMFCKSFVILDTNYRTVLKISYNKLDVGLKSTIKKSGIIQLPVKAPYIIEFNTTLLNKLSQINPQDFKVNGYDGNILNGLLKFHDTGLYSVNLKAISPDNSGSTQAYSKIEVDKATGAIVSDSKVPDGRYKILWSDYLKTDSFVEVVENKLPPLPPIPEVITSEDKIEFFYPGFNFSHSTFLKLFGLKIIVFK